MGYMVHHTIVVSCWDDKLLRKTWREAKKIFSHSVHRVSNITSPANNSYRSYFIAPDGSKATWDCSRKGWGARKEFIEYLKELIPYPPDWVLVQFADDGGNNLVLDCNGCKKSREHRD